MAAAVADLARSGPLHVPAGKVLDNIRASARAAHREMAEEAIVQNRGGGKSVEGGGAVVDALEYVLHQASVDETQLRFCRFFSARVVATVFLS